MRKYQPFRTIHFKRPTGLSLFNVMTLEQNLRCSIPISTITHAGHVVDMMYNVQQNS